ncbi:hypothetical protein [Okeania sp. SIO2C2]|uniref:hypothetical protein n=1 Tax=Okeania sp. SIO2C2 TaxID=2607787 RepID=UPI00257F6373|nr:hypothetical protein [Okeania sp. SIO2C2]
MSLRDYYNISSNMGEKIWEREIFGVPYEEFVNRPLQKRGNREQGTGNREPTPRPSPSQEGNN